MTCCHGSVPQEVRPGTARVLVTELSGSGHFNPTPAAKPCEESETAVELYLSPEKLEALCGAQDLSHVTSLKLSVDTQENILGNFGAYLPRLAQLKMNNSIIMSVRDLGTSLSHLQILWMSHCCLQDLGGISTLISLKTADYSYRVSVRELVPQLHYLDDVRVEEDRLSCSSIMGEDWAILQNSIRDCSSSQDATDDEETAGSTCPYSRPSSARRPASCRSGVWPLVSAGSRPHTGSRPTTANWSGVLSPPGSRPGSADSDLTKLEAETSILTHGAGKILFCGNPAQAIRARREKLRTAPNQSTFTPRDLPIHVPEHTYDLEEPDVREREDVFAELKAWREQHSRRLQVIETERLPQILAIQYSDDEEEEEDDDEKEGFNGMKKDNKEHMEGMHSYNVDTASLDSSFQSLSPVLHHREPISPGVARLSLSTDATMSPFPPLRATAASGCPKQQGIRARRLRLSKASSEHLSYSSTAGCSAGTGMTAGDTDPAVHGVQQVTRTTVPLISQAAHRPYPPPTSALGEGLMSSCLAKDVSSGQSGDKHQMSKLLGRPPITRPHTARAALQKHHQQRILQPCRGSSYPD
ncbi:leucine-rich repeat-containing protein 56 isoform X2 [Mastacembelus armatus]|nr:leucine-rich repeat-containing protein 56 isoform X2 [Mastacembelus armatus]